MQRAPVLFAAILHLYEVWLLRRVKSVFPIVHVGQRTTNTSGHALEDVADAISLFARDYRVLARRRLGEQRKCSLPSFCECPRFKPRSLARRVPDDAQCSEGPGQTPAAVPLPAPDKRC